LTDIAVDEISIMKHAWKSLVFNNGKPWIKRDRQYSLFDVTMGSYDGDEICELACRPFHIVNHLGKKFGKAENIGLHEYRLLSILYHESVHIIYILYIYIYILR
jgi:hypothetical protein